MWRARYAHNTTHQRFDDIAKLKRQILSGRIESTECVTKEIIVVVWTPRNFIRSRLRVYISGIKSLGSLDLQTIYSQRGCRMRNFDRAKF